MKHKILLIVMLFILITGCIGIYNSNRNGRFVFLEANNNKIMNLEKDMTLEDLSTIVFTEDKDTKKVSDISDLELIHDIVSISTKYIDTITGKEIKRLGKKYFNVDNIKFVDITCNLPMSEDHDNRMYIYNPKTDKYEYNQEHISHGGISNGITYYIVNKKETIEDDYYIYSGNIFYVYNGCSWDICGNTNIYDVYLSYSDALNKVNKQFNAYEKEELCKKSKCNNNKIYEEIKDNVKTVSFYYKKNNDNYVFDYYEVK